MNAALAQIQEKIMAACRQAGRDPSSVTLLAVSKGQEADKIRALAALGHKSFGENYLQEAQGKQETLAELGLDWHFVGALQTNKAKLVVGNFSLVHSVDRPELARKLQTAAAQKGIVQDCLVEVNVDAEGNKAGIAPGALPDFLHELALCEHLRVTGLMCIPEAAPEDPRRPFARLRELLDTANRSGAYPRELRQLSMGMSGDYEAAVLEGATIVRVGTALFGARAARKP